MRLFHYTVGLWFIKIVESKSIKPEDNAWLQPGQRPVVWFTTKMLWEETANKSSLQNGKLIFLDRYQTEIMGEGLVRIEIDPDAAPHTWRDYKKMSGLSEKMLKDLLKIAKKKGARPEIEWRFSLDPVRMDQWVSIEMWNGQKWKSAYE